MQAAGTIRHLAHIQIDKLQWDNCIHASYNGVIYANSFYLDHMSPGWEALVLGDYQVVMPLTWRKKWRIRYLCQPAFSPQLGLFGSGAITPEMVGDFVAAARQRFRFAEIFFNHYNSFDGFTSKHCNLVISLLPSIEKLQDNFATSLRKNLSQADRFQLSYTVTADYKEAIRQYKERYGHAMAHITEPEYGRFERLCETAQENKQLIVRMVLASNGDLLAIGLLLKDHRRIYNLISTTLPNGRTLGANHLLYAELMKEFSGQPLTLDLEGSDLPGVARFYRKFGAVDEPYYFLRFNRLPSVVRWLKPV